MWLNKRRVRPNDIKHYMNELVHSTGTTHIYETTRIISQMCWVVTRTGWVWMLGDTQMLHECLGCNSVPVHMSRGNTKPLHHIKSKASVDGSSVSQTFSTAQESSHHILNTLMLKLNFNMPKVKKARKTQKRDRSPSPEVSEWSTESAQATTEVEIHASKEPEGPYD